MHYLLPINILFQLTTVDTIHEAQQKTTLTYFCAPYTCDFVKAYFKINTKRRNENHTSLLPLC